MSLGINLYAKEGDEVCFTQDQTEKMAVEIKDGRIANQLNMKYEATIEEKEKQIKNFEGQIDVLGKKIDEAMRQIETNKTISEGRDEARLKEIEELKKPRWGSLFGSFGIGAGAMALLLLLL